MKYNTGDTYIHTRSMTSFTTGPSFTHTNPLYPAIYGAIQGTLDMISSNTGKHEHTLIHQGIYTH